MSNRCFVFENGAHQAKITEVATDRNGRHVVTVSNDKTVRVWNSADGSLLSVIRPPIGPDKDGMLYAVAISPDGRLIAVGGWTGGRNNHSIYIFDRETGLMTSRVGGFEDVIFGLAYSPDGRWLAATLAGSYGIRIFDTARYELVMEDRDYGDASERADFNSSSSQIATSSFDGFIRTYRITDGTILFERKGKPVLGKRPVDVKFSPDGNKIAVGFVDTKLVTVISAKDLSSLYNVDVSQVKDGTRENPTFLPVVTWSADGNTIYAGGTNYDSGGHFVISAWTESGKNYRHIPASDLPVYDLDSLPNGQIVFSSTSHWGDRRSG